MAPGAVFHAMLSARSLTLIPRVAFKSEVPHPLVLQVPAICLAIVQNYTLLQNPWRLARRSVRLDDDAEAGPAEYKHLLLLKAACEVRREGRVPGVAAARGGCIFSTVQQ